VHCPYGLSACYLSSTYLYSCTEWFLRVLYMMNDMHPCQLHISLSLSHSHSHTHTQEYLTNNGREENLSQERRNFGNLLPHKKKTHLLIMEKPVDTTKITDGCTSEQLVW
jgi:hypothetical protein